MAYAFREIFEDKCILEKAFLVVLSTLLVLLEPFTSLLLFSTRYFRGLLCCAWPGLTSLRPIPTFRPGVLSVLPGLFWSVLASSTISFS